MSRSYESIQNGIRRHLSLNDDGSDTSEDETSRLLSYPPSHTDHYTIPGPEGKDIEVESEDVHEGTRSQHSIITIFSLWNTMMGTSLLSMPWAIKQAGFVNGLVLLIVCAGIMAYSSYRVLAASKSGAGGALVEFSVIVRSYLGRFAEIFAMFCSVSTFLGGCIVYWILMSNFLYHIGVFIYNHTKSPHVHKNTSLSIFASMTSKFSDVTCDNQTASPAEYQSKSFADAWNETETVPLYLIAILFPLVNFKSPTFFTKFNALGTLSVTYLAIFVSVKAGEWGLNLDLHSGHSDKPDYSSNFEWTFPALTGVAALAYFVQNSIVAIVRNQKHPENDIRDLVIAYVLVCLTYTFMGSLFYAAFPLEKSCIEDNFLNNIASTDVMAFVARICLFFQMTCVFPLLLYIIRAQSLPYFFNSVWPSWKHVILLNIVIVAICVVFAMFLPNIGHIIGFVGAFAGFSYAIFLPCLVYLIACYRNGTLSVIKIVLHSILIVLGLANFAAQFVILGHTS